MPKVKRVALVSGANRGIGLEVSRQLAAKGYTVVMGARNATTGKRAAHALRKQGLDVVSHQLDVTKQPSVDRLYKFIKREFGRLDVLVNNAGVYLDAWSSSGYKNRASAFAAKTETIRASFDVNTLGPFRLSQKFIPLMAKQGYGRVVNVSSGMGQLTHMNGSSPGYRLSKVALNALTRIFSEETKGSGVAVNSVCPGWVRTRMGGKGADRPVEKGAATIVWLATLPRATPTGGFFRDKKKIPW